MRPTESKLSWKRQAQPFKFSKPHYCEWRPYPWIPNVCFEPVTHQLDSVSGDIDSNKYYFATWYVCRKHAMEGVSMGFALAFSLETDMVDGEYTFETDQPLTIKTSFRDLNRARSQLGLL